MAKLTTLKPQVSRIKPLIGPAPGEPERNRYRDQHQPWRAWYKTGRWRALRWDVLRRHHFICRMCGSRHSVLTAMCEALDTACRLDTLTEQRFRGYRTDRIADHIRPHRGDEALFWDSNNLQCLCKQCHDGDKQRQERRR